ncbi:MAG: SBBP repeat-containing protein [Candidatus Cloacimonetes bacterium]|nr:SBBP repeat-containing protein [Candidatus Cloacimonadota bacterium]
MRNLKAMLHVVVFLCGSYLYAQGLDWQWANHASGSNYDEGKSVAVGADGSSYVAGCFYGDISFGNTSLTSQGGSDLIVAKLDPQGNWLWAKQVGDAENQEANGIAIDNSGGIYVCGMFNGTASFGQTTLTSDNRDICIAKIDGEGNWLWAKKAGGNSDDSANAIAVDSTNGIYLTGIVKNLAFFGNIQNASENTGGDGYVAKLDSEGNWLWVLRADGISPGYGITADTNGYIYVTGRFDGYVAFGEIHLTSLSYSDIYVLKVSAAGAWIWAKSAGGTGIEHGKAITTDSLGNIYLTGYLGSNSTNFGQINLSQIGLNDLFIAKLDPEGNWLWAEVSGSTGNDCGWGICCDAVDNFYITGITGMTANFLGYPLPLSCFFIGKFNSDGLGLGAWQPSLSTTSGSTTGYCLASDGEGGIYCAGSYQGSFMVDGILIANSGLTDLFVVKANSSTALADSYYTPPAGFTLMGAFPNPFSISSSVQFNVKDAHNAMELCIYNYKGEKIRALRKTDISLGENSINWDGKNDRGEAVSSGIYLYKLSCGKTATGGKLVRIK